MSERRESKGLPLRSNPWLQIPPVVTGITLRPFPIPE
jgi:hypothetical protein